MLRVADRPHRRPFRHGGGLRPLDQPLCPYIPTGTPFPWHVLNAVVLYLVVSVVTYRWRETETLRLG